MENNTDYREKTIEMLNKINNQDYLFKIYHYTLAKYRKDNEKKNTNVEKC